MKSRKKILIVNPADNVGVALTTIMEGVHATSGGRSTEAREEIPKGFKIALKDIRKGGPVVKYGEIIGLASRPIKRGDQVHVHNCGSRRGKG